MYQIVFTILEDNALPAEGEKENASRNMITERGEGLVIVKDSLQSIHISFQRSIMLSHGFYVCISQIASWKFCYFKKRGYNFE